MSLFHNSVLLRCAVGVLLAFSGACALPGGPPLPDIADKINSTLEPLEVIDSAPTAVGPDVTSRSVSVLGEVMEPGAIALEPGRRLTLVEAIARAGGHRTATAHVSSLVLVRWDRTTQQQLAWTIDARPKYWSSAKPIFLQPYDIVYIPNIPIDDLGHWVDNYMRRLIPIPFPVFTIR
ncbi:MAG: hypothetical protein JNL28_14570 [Planctomycetes bacterium]|nr:hypothetical protein [Planctomycetota bacterium]